MIARAYQEAAKQWGSHSPVQLYDGAKLKELEDRRRRAFQSLPVDGEKGDGANARDGKGQGPGSLLGTQADIIADSLAKIGGGGGVAGVSAALEEARAQTNELKAQTSELKEIKQGIQQLTQGRGGARLEITTIN